MGAVDEQIEEDREHARTQPDQSQRGLTAPRKFLLTEICDAASAAPTLYPPVPTTAPKRRWLVDGALAINDPSQCAIGEALDMGHTLDEIFGSVFTR